MRRFILITCLFITYKISAQINAFPATESFESTFVEGLDLEFIPNWTGNEVDTDRRLFPSSDARTGLQALAVIPLSSFDGEILISLDLTNFVDGQISFYAKSNTNGSGTRPSLVHFSTSVDNGASFSAPIQIGTETTFPNEAGQSYSQFMYSIPSQADGQGNVLIKILIERSETIGSGSAAEVVFDDFEFTATQVSDSDPPTIVGLEVLSPDSLVVSFSEALEQSTAESEANYTVSNGIGNPSSATQLEDNYSVALKFLTAFADGQENSLTVGLVEDEAGNIMQETTIQFTYLEPYIPHFRDVVINEVMPDPPPSTSGIVPTVEYVELYNNTDKQIDLAGWVLAGATSSGQSFPPFLLAPSSFLLLTNNENVGEFTGPDVISWGGASNTALTNGGETLILLDPNGIVVDSLVYSGSTDGVAIEQINPALSFFLDSNYANSAAEDGGTPGSQNSIFNDIPDATPPLLLSIAAVSATELNLIFSELLDQSSAENQNNYLIDCGVLVESASLNGSDASVVSLRVSELPSAETRILTVNGIKDLFGNAIDNASQDFIFIRTELAEPGDLIINEFLASPSQQGGGQQVEYVELLNRSTKYIDLAGWKLKDRSNESDPFSSYIIWPDSLVVLTGEGNKGLFELPQSVLEVSDFPALNNSGDDIGILDASQQLIDALKYTTSEEGVSMELINPDDPCRTIDSYRPSKDSGGGTPGKTNSIFDNSPDTTAPTVLSFGYSNSLVINFSEIMEPSALLNTLNYSSSELTVREILTTAAFTSSVEVVFNEPIVPGETYEVSIAGLADCWGNEIEPTIISFGFGRSLSFNEIIFTEILFDESPSQGLPEAEYLEIYNASDDIISLAGLSLADATSQIDLPTVNLQPQTYYVLTSAAKAQEFSTNAIGINGFPSLNNSGEQLLLILDGDLISSLRYDPDWHEEENKGGGVSLELVDITNPCLEDGSNWRSSEAVLGGTPGQPNSISEVLPDSFGPELDRVVAISSDSVLVQFSEKIHPDLSDVRVVIEPELTIEIVIPKVSDPYSVFLLLAEELAPSELYSISIENVFDCASNEIESDEVNFALPIIAEGGQIKLSEVLFNPRSGGVDFVEIYNDSDDYIRLKEWQLARITEEGVDDQKVISDEELVISPSEYLVFTSDVNILISNYPRGEANQFVELTSLPTYSNDTGNVVLINQDEEVVEHFRYEEDFHYNLLESPDGVSLERISFDVPVNVPDNWRSASSTEGFATPGYANSQGTSIKISSTSVEAVPKVFIPGDAARGRDFTLINYQFGNPGQFANVNIYDQNGRLVKNLAKGVLLSTSGFFRWDGETNGGEMARMGYYLILFEVYDASGFTEVIKETVVVGREF